MVGAHIHHQSHSNTNTSAEEHKVLSQHNDSTTTKNKLYSHTNAASKSGYAIVRTIQTNKTITNEHSV
jgi:hypothetical protein